MSKAYTTGRIGIETLTDSELKYWEKKGVKYRPILEYKPLTKQEEDRLKTEYYDNNNRVGYEKLYAAVRQPNGQTRTGKDQYSPTIRQVQAWLAQQEVAQDDKPVEKPKETRSILASAVNDLIQTPDGLRGDDGEDDLRESPAHPECHRRAEQESIQPQPVDAGRHCADGSTDAEVSQGDLRSEL